MTSPPVLPGGFPPSVPSSVPSSVPFKNAPFPFQEPIPKEERSREKGERLAEGGEGGERGEDLVEVVEQFLSRIEHGNSCLL